MRCTFGFGLHFQALFHQGIPSIAIEALPDPLGISGAA
jgi:hypothetical protein